MHRHVLDTQRADGAVEFKSPPVIPSVFMAGPRALTTTFPLYLINASAERFILPDAVCTVGTHVDAVLYLFVRGHCERMTHFLPGLCPLLCSSRGVQEYCKRHMSVDIIDPPRRVLPFFLPLDHYVTIFRLFVC